MSFHNLLANDLKRIKALVLVGSVTMIIQSKSETKGPSTKVDLHTEIKIKGYYVKMLLLLFTRPLLRDGGMAEDHGAPEAEQLPRVCTRGRREIESHQRVSGAESVAGQCRMR